VIVPRRVAGILSFLSLFFFASLLIANGRATITTGSVLSLSEKGPVLEQTLCGEEAFGTGYFSFFHPDGKTLCARGTRSYQNAVFIVIPRSNAPVTLPPPWRLVDGADSILLYDETATVPEGSDETGTLLAVTPLGFYVDDGGSLRAPRFIRRGDTWEPVFPLRELFRIQVTGDREFTVSVGSSADLSEAAKDPLNFLGIVAEKATIRGHDTHLLLVEGSGFSVLDIPRFRMTPDGDAFGRYLVEITGPIPFQKQKESSLTAGSLTARIEQTTGGAIRIECLVMKRSVPADDFAKLGTFLKKSLPARYEVKKR